MTGEWDVAEAAVDGWVAAWNEGCSEARHQLLAAAVGEGCVFDGPAGTVVGHQALHAAIAEARDFLPGATVVRNGPVWAHEGGLRFAWEVRSAEGVAVLAGVDTVELDAAGRLTRVVVLPAPSPSADAASHRRPSGPPAP